MRLSLFQIAIDPFESRILLCPLNDDVPPVSQRLIVGSTEDELHWPVAATFGESGTHERKCPDRRYGLPIGHDPIDSILG